MTINDIFGLERLEEPTVPTFSALKKKEEDNASDCLRTNRRPPSKTEDYIERFEAMAAPLPQLSDEVLKVVFLNGLKPVVRAEVLAIEPDGLDQIMRKAQLVEDIDLAAQGDGGTLIGKGDSNQATTGTGKGILKNADLSYTRVVTLATKGQGNVVSTESVPQ